jgi:hypothetical protein
MSGKLIFHLITKHFSFNIVKSLYIDIGGCKVRSRRHGKVQVGAAALVCQSPLSLYVGTGEADHMGDRPRAAVVPVSSLLEHPDEVVEQDFGLPGSLEVDQCQSGRAIRDPRRHWPLLLLLLTALHLKINEQKSIIN